METFNFSKALEHLKSNGVAFAKRQIVKNDTVIVMHKKRLYQMSESTGVRYSYTPSNSDLMADDWVLSNNFVNAQVSNDYKDLKIDKLSKDLTEIHNELSVLEETVSRFEKVSFKLPKNYKSISVSTLGYITVFVPKDINTEEWQDLEGLKFKIPKGEWVIASVGDDLLTLKRVYTI